MAGPDSLATMRERPRGVRAPEAGHLERVGHASAGGQGKVLQVAVDVVVRNQHRLALAQQLGGMRGERFALTA